MPQRFSREFRNPVHPRVIAEQLSENHPERIRIKGQISAKRDRASTEGRASVSPEKPTLALKGPIVRQQDFEPSPDDRQVPIGATVCSSAEDRQST